MNIPVTGEKYRHYKRRTTYRIVCIGVIEATEEACVVYEALDPEAEHRFWVRPLEDFCGQVQDDDGGMVSRFERLISE